MVLKSLQALDIAPPCVPLSRHSRPSPMAFSHACRAGWRSYW
jgi:hypothetical protein